MPHSFRIDYEVAVRAVAAWMAQEGGCAAPSVGHYNDARKALSAALTDEERFKLVAR